LASHEEFALSLYVAAAQVLRRLADSGEPLLDEDGDGRIRDVLAVGARACTRLDEVEYERDRALRDVAHLRGVLMEAAEVLAAEPLPTEGGSWPLFELAQMIQGVLAVPERVEEGSQ
jgi:hypothetical protein